MGYDYEIIYRPGRENYSVVSLSYKQGSPMLHSIFTPQVTLWEEIKKAAAKDWYIFFIKCNKYIDKKQSWKPNSYILCINRDKEKEQTPLNIVGKFPHKL